MLPVIALNMFTFKAIQLGRILLPGYYNHPAAVLTKLSINRFLKNQIMFVNNKLYKTSKVFGLLLNLCAAGAITKANQREGIHLGK